MELDKLRARCSCSHLRKTLLKVLSGSANLRRKRLWLALRVLAPTEPLSLEDVQDLLLCLSVLASQVSLPRPLAAGKHWALCTCPLLPPSLLHFSGGQTASRLMLGFHLLHRQPHTYTFAVFMVKNPCSAGQEPPALVCRVK